MNWDASIAGKRPASYYCALFLAALKLGEVRKKQ